MLWIMKTNVFGILYLLETFWLFKMKNILLEIWAITSWYQSLGSRDSGTLLGVSGHKLRKWSNCFQKIKAKTSKNRKRESVMRVPGVQGLEFAIR